MVSWVAADIQSLKAKLFRPIRSQEGSAGFLLLWEKTTDQVKFDREFVELVECVSMIFKMVVGSNKHNGRINFLVDREIRLQKVKK